MKRHLAGGAMVFASLPSAMESDQPDSVSEPYESIKRGEKVLFCRCATNQMCVETLLSCF